MPNSEQRSPALTDETCTVSELRQVMRGFVAERNWERFHTAKNLSMSIAIECGELMEHFQWLTEEELSTGTGFDRAEVADELADVACYVLSLANALDLDLTSAIREKMVKNRKKYPAPRTPGETGESISTA